MQFARYPTYKRAYIRAFEKMLEVRKRKGLKMLWENADEVFHWWMEDGVLPGQMQFDDLEADDED